MGSSHLPCHVVGEFDGRYQLYCSKGVLDNTFSRAEVIPMARCTPIPMEEWRQAPKVSLRSDSAIIERCKSQCVLRTQTSLWQDCTAEGVCIPGPFWGVCTDHTC